MPTVRETASQMTMELHQAARLLRRTFDRYAKEHGLSTSRWQVLYQLTREQGLKQSELAERMDVAPISLARQLDNLEQEGLVERRRDQGDRRCFRIYLHEAAEPVLDTLRNVANLTRSDALAGLSKTEVEQLSGLLARVRANLAKEESSE
ncbi:MarR family winged helix-turn-helix transcriptional regulator [Haliea atlantica]|tara:strand:- start:541 stop:990 length:450 start_codon:yes stop_codon:yes gene_type:complete